LKAGPIPVKPTPKGFTESKGRCGIQENSCDTTWYHGKKVKILMGTSKNCNAHICNVYGHYIFQNTD
jgi:hypothetical protein